MQEARRVMMMEFATKVKTTARAVCFFFTRPL